MQGKDDCVTDLIVSKAKVNLLTKTQGFTALMLAAESGSVECVQLLLLTYRYRVTLNAI